ncbi:glycosyltransferase family 2 protein [Subtercola sp. RTI3]|uniref:glycosyltransferase family 2 protein n=1 Tax=Subtercola sp. RTI3 TaxID=3048639 RepID=UPI002B239532|nr:glycosyltransferase family 2 protein [Subtercola sp. RTI3]MEA9984420.1 glycosyltransferase family 2 protein [Subtercola sp. RTI3]
MTGTVALVTVSYFSEDDVLSCLASVPAAAASTARSGLELCVVNNAASDPLSALEGTGASVLTPGTNLGYGGAVNFAAATLGPEVEWILVTNPDVQFEPGSVDELMRVATGDERIGVVGPRVTNDDGTIYPSARDLPSLTSGAGHAVLHRVWPANPWSKRYLRADKSATTGTDPVAAGWLSGSCMLVRRAAFDAVDGFDHRFFMYFEDVDLAERLGLAGYSVLYVPTATVMHAGGTSTRSHSAAMLKAHHHSAYLYLAKRYHEWYYLPVRVALRVGLGLRSALGQKTK